MLVARVIRRRYVGRVRQHMDLTLLRWQLFAPATCLCLCLNCPLFHPS